MSDGPRWLSESEQRSWRAYLDATRVLFARLDHDLQAATGIPGSYYEILVRLSEAPERTLRMSELADVTRSSRSRLSHAVARLEEHGWVDRRACPDDARGALAVLTDAGFDALAAAAPVHVSQVRSHLVDVLSAAELAALGAISAKLLAHLEADGPSTAD